MLDPAIVPYLASGILICLALLFIFTVPPVIKTSKRMDEFIRSLDEDELHK